MCCCQQEPTEESDKVKLVDETKQATNVLGTAVVLLCSIYDGVFLQHVEECGEGTKGISLVQWIWCW